MSKLTAMPDKVRQVFELIKEYIKTIQIMDSKTDTSQKLVIGCNYHTTWQKHSAMRFVLVEIKGSKARLQTRNTGKDFWTDIKDLIFIETNYNKRKADNLAFNLPKENINDLVSEIAENTFNKLHNYTQTFTQK